MAISSSVPPRMGPLQYGDLNLKSMQSRNSLAKSLNEQCPGFPWSEALLQVCEHAVRTKRSGEPRVNLLSVPARAASRWLLWPYIEHGGPSILYAPGGSAKSLFALAIGISVATGIALVGEMRGTPGPVLFLDWEAEQYTHNERLRALLAGAFETPPKDVPIEYKRMYGSLYDNVSAVKRDIQQMGAVLVVIDSISWAAGGDLSDALTAQNYYDAVRRLVIPCEGVGHVPKNGVPGRDLGEAGPFGSVMWRNGCRNMHQLDAAQDEGSSVLRARLVSRKSNNSRPAAQHGYEFRFATVSADDDRLAQVVIRRSDLASDPIHGDKLPFASRIQPVLARGGKTTKEVAEELGMSEAATQKALEREVLYHRITRLSRGFYGLATQTEIPF